MINGEFELAMSSGSAATSSSKRSDLSVPGVPAASGDSNDNEKVDGDGDGDVVPDIVRSPWQAMLRSDKRSSD
jgi:hypothetical protein